MIFVLEYTDTDNFTYWNNCFAFLEAESEEHLFVFLSESIEKNIINIDEKFKLNLNPKSKHYKKEMEDVQNYLNYEAITIGNHQIGLHNVIDLKDDNGQIILTPNFSFISLETFLENNKFVTPTIQ